MRLALKAFAFGVSVWILRAFDFSFWANIIFFASAFVIYQSQINKRFKVSFFLLWLGGYLVGGIFLWEWLFGATLILLFLIAYWLFGLGDLAFKNRQLVYQHANTGLFFLAFLIFFSLNRWNLFPLKYFGIWLAVFLLFFESFKSLIGKFPRREKFVALVFSLLILELVWTVLMLPIGFINSAALLALFAFLIRDSVWNYFEGKLNKNFILNMATLGIIFVLIIFAASRWVL